MVYTRKTALTRARTLTQRKTAVELQVGGEQSGQTAEQPAAGLPPVQLVAAVHQAVGRGAVVSLVQDAHQQLPLANHHLGNQHRQLEDEDLQKVYSAPTASFTSNLGAHMKVELEF